MNNFDKQYNLLIEKFENKQFQTFLEATLSEDLAFKIFDKLANAEHLIKSGWRILKFKFKEKDNSNFKQRAERYFKNWDEHDKLIQDLEQTVKSNSSNETTINIVSNVIKNISEKLPQNKNDKTIVNLEKNIQKPNIKNKILDFVNVAFSPTEKSDSSISMKIMHLYLLTLGLMNKNKYIDFQ